MNYILPFELVFTKGVEPSKAYALNIVTVPICICHMNEMCRIDLGYHSLFLTFFSLMCQ